MSQPSVANYFSTRKRSALDDKLVRAKKVLILEGNESSEVTSEVTERLNDGKSVIFVNKPIINSKSAPNHEKFKTNPGAARKIVRKVGPKKVSESGKQREIQDFFNNVVAKPTPPTTPKKQTLIETSLKSPETVVQERHVTPPNTPTKVVNRLDKVNDHIKEPSIKEIRQKLTRSHRLTELRASIARFKESSQKLEQAEKKTAKVAESPTLKNFKTIEFDVQLSPQKVFSPEKSYLSPKKESSARKNLLHLLSPSKSALGVSLSPKKDVFSTTKPPLTLPFKYRTLAEIFRCIDTVCQILYNRKEVVTFRKLKPAVEEMLKKNLTEKHLGQIKTIFQDAFKFSQEKLRVFGAGCKKEQWELVVTPNITGDTLTSEVLLQRRRKLYDILIDKLKDYHGEFLSSLDPAIEVPRDKVTRWHPEFDIERVPDIETSKLPQPPDEIKLTTGKEVLEKAREMFQCNTRMEEALARLEQRKAMASKEETQKPQEIQSVLKGIPKALLEKVRQKQAAKALMSITRSADKEKEIEVYGRLPEIARVVRNIFVAEKKGVLPLSVVIEKLGNSFRAFVSRADMQEHLQIIAKEVPGWLVFHEVRNSTFLKLSKNADVNVVINKLNDVFQQKSAT